MSLSLHSPNRGLLLKSWQWGGWRENSYHSFRDCPPTQKSNNTQRTGHLSGQRQRYSFSKLKRTDSKAKPHFLSGAQFELLHSLSRISEGSTNIQRTFGFMTETPETTTTCHEDRGGKALPLRSVKTSHLLKMTACSKCQNKTKDCPGLPKTEGVPGCRTLGFKTGIVWTNWKAPVTLGNLFLSKPLDFKCNISAKTLSMRKDTSPTPKKGHDS